MSTLTEFLLARIAEDAAAERELWGPSAPLDGNRVLTECEAKRRIVERYDYLAEHGDTGDARWVLPLLALPYAQHPDYDETWRP